MGPGTEPEPITLTLTDGQRQALLELVGRQATEHKGLLLCSAAPYFCFKAGEVRLRLQAVFPRWNKASSTFMMSI
jgi:hypothetical protein